jgi:hypothetical protein
MNPRVYRGAIHGNGQALRAALTATMAVFFWPFDPDLIRDGCRLHLALNLLAFL